MAKEGVNDGKQGLCECKSTAQTPKTVDYLETVDTLFGFILSLHKVLAFRKVRLGLVFVLRFEGVYACQRAVRADEVLVRPREVSRLVGLCRSARIQNRAKGWMLWAGTTFLSGLECRLQHARISTAKLFAVAWFLRGKQQ